MLKPVEETKSTSESFPLISVIIPVYNVQQYLRECVSSVLAQVYSNLEIILIDDGSTDESGKLCDEFALSDERISVFHKTNGGLSRARNYGVEHCHGDWILFVDSDDYVSPVYVGALWTAVESRHCNMAAFAFSLPFQDGDVADLAQSMSDVRAAGDIKVLPAKDYIDNLLYRYYDTGAYCCLYRREELISHPFPDMVFEDAATVYRIAYDAEEIALIPCNNLYAYRNRQGSIMNKGVSYRLVDSAIRLGRRVYDDMNRWYPGDASAAASCGFSITRVVLLKTTRYDVKLRRALWHELCSYRHDLLMDKRAKKIKRFAAAASYLGMHSFIALSKAMNHFTR